MSPDDRLALIAEVTALPPGRLVPVQTLAHSFTREELLAMLTAEAELARVRKRVAESPYSLFFADVLREAAP